jgi:hypothetical protein
MARAASTRVEVARRLLARRSLAGTMVVLDRILGLLKFGFLRITPVIDRCDPSRALIEPK